MKVEVIVIGASIGGLDAVGSVLRALPVGFRPAVIVVQHRRAGLESFLVEIMNRQTSLPVSEPDDKEEVRGGRVYLAPADYHLLVEDGHFALSVDAPISFARPSIDALFASVADAYGGAAVAAVLTGASSDGADGAAAVKEAGGRVLVQDPETAESKTLPCAVLARTAVDGVFSLDQLAAELVRISEA